MGQGAKDKPKNKGSRCHIVVSGNLDQLDRGKYKGAELNPEEAEADHMNWVGHSKSSAIAAGCLNHSVSSQILLPKSLDPNKAEFNESNDLTEKNGSMVAEMQEEEMEHCPSAMVDQ